MKRAVAIGFLLGQILAANSLSQDANPQIDSSTRETVIEAVLRILAENYAFPDMAQQMVISIRNHQQRKDYDTITDGIQFAEKLTIDLQQVNHDRHIRVRFSARSLRETEGGRRSAEEQERTGMVLRKTNFGFEEVQRLPGNIGYLDLREFGPAALCVDTAAAAMNFLASTDALIIDLRQNMGGDPNMVALLASYLFENKPVHLNDLHWRAGDRVQESWTQSAVAGRRYGSVKQVYVLTSHQTFSASEEFAYDLQALKRAKIIGENTGGGANPGENRRVAEHFSIFVPTGRAINPTTRTNWEGVGVKPDLEVSAEKALKVAHLAAMKKVVESISDEQLRNAILRQIERVQKELDDSH